MPTSGKISKISLKGFSAVIVFSKSVTKTGLLLLLHLSVTTFGTLGSHDQFISCLEEEIIFLGIKDNDVTTTLDTEQTETDKSNFSFTRSFCASQSF